MDSPLVSVVIPIYNSEPYLERCLESILNQHYSNIEIVLVNDGSTDKSQEICQDYVGKNPDRICLLNQPNQGASIARKNGILAARGTYIVFMDSDDFVSPHYISALYAALVEANTNIALCPMKRIGVGENPGFSDTYTTRLLLEKELFRRFFKYEFWGFWGGIYRKELFDNVIFPEATVNEDYYVKAQMLVAERKVGYVEEPLYCYEQHPGSLSKQPLSLRALGEFDNALATWNFIKANSPEYSNHALAIASEAACKWLGVLNQHGDVGSDYKEYRDRIRLYVKKRFIDIMMNRHLLWKIKVVLVKNILNF